MARVLVPLTSAGSMAALRRASAKNSRASSISALATTRPFWMPMRYSWAASWAVAARRRTAVVCSLLAGCCRGPTSTIANRIRAPAPMRIIFNRFGLCRWKLESAGRIWKEQ